MDYKLSELIELYGITDLFPNTSRSFKQFQVQEILYIPPQKPDMERILSVHVNIEINSKTVIHTSHGISYEGQILTGKKLVIEGCLHQKVEYIADNPLQSVHVAHFTMPFSSYIILDDKANCENEYDVRGYIEDIYVKQVGTRKIFKNVMILLHTIPRL